MRNITVSVTDDVYREARIWAAENNRSVSAAVRYFLENIRRILRVHKPPETARQEKNIRMNFGCENVAQSTSPSDPIA